MVPCQYASKEKNVLKNTLLPCGFREDTAPKQLTNHNARNLSLVETDSLSGGLCGHQDLNRTATKYMRIIYL